MTQSKQFQGIDGHGNLRTYDFISETPQIDKRELIISAGRTQGDGVKSSSKFKINVLEDTEKRIRRKDLTIDDIMDHILYSPAFMVSERLNQYFMTDNSKGTIRFSVFDTRNNSPVDIDRAANIPSYYRIEFVFVTQSFSDAIEYVMFFVVVAGFPLFDWSIPACFGTI